MKRSFTLTLFLILCLVDLLPAQFYPLVSIPPELQSPSGEHGQILVSGIINDISVFHGRGVGELDWICSLTVPDSVKSSIANQFKNKITEYNEDIKKRNNYVVPLFQGFLIPKDYNLDVSKLSIYSKIMVIDSLQKKLLGSKFYSSDLTKALGLELPTYDLSHKAMNNPGKAIKFGHLSKIVNNKAFTYLQGAFVNDASRGIRIEIHPLDGIAYALDENGIPVKNAYDPNSWPKDSITWMIGGFTNSKAHRINNEAYLTKERTTTWLLDLPLHAGENPYYDSKDSLSSKFNFEYNILKTELHHAITRKSYTERGLRFITDEIIRNPDTNRLQLRLNVRMAPADMYGGNVLYEIVVKVKKPDNDSH